MTLTELHNEVRALGFDNSLECDARLVAAASCALRTLFSEMEVRCERRLLIHSTAPPALPCDHIWSNESPLQDQYRYR